VAVAAHGPGRSRFAGTCLPQEISIIMDYLNPTGIDS
jgi:hypothetical protein